jgi:ADP-ribosylglycohydrolase
MPTLSADTSPSLVSRIYGCWLGKSIGGTLGLPSEGCTQRQNFTFYDPIPTEAPPNDDLELQLVWLHLLETRGPDLTQQDFADAWVAHIHYMWDEYGRCRWNLRRGVPLPDVGVFENPFLSGMGSPIRSEIWACICGGDADLAARYAALDASLDHGPEGIAGEVYFAVLQSLVLAGVDLTGALREAARRVDPATETAQALQLVSTAHANGVEAWACRDQLLAAHDSENFTHAPLNVALTAWALLYGGADFEKSILLAVNGGYDTDCTAATVGATLGFMLGADGIPALWREPIGDSVAVGPGIIGIAAPTTLTELTERTCRVAETLASALAPALHLPAPTGKVEVSGLPGTITLLPLDGSAPIAWANGELPDAVKKAGGAEWTWRVAQPGAKPYQLIALAKTGARLYVDGVLVVDCPPGLPYVPAPHRCPWDSHKPFTPNAVEHRVRVELGTAGSGQAASVILGTANRHLEAWSGETLPHAPELA